MLSHGSGYTHVVRLSIGIPVDLAAVSGLQTHGSPEPPAALAGHDTTSHVSISRLPSVHKSDPSPDDNQHCRPTPAGTVLDLVIPTVSCSILYKQATHVTRIRFARLFRQVAMVTGHLPDFSGGACVCSQSGGIAYIAGESTGLSRLDSTTAQVSPG